MIGVDLTTLAVLLVGFAILLDGPRRRRLERRIDDLEQQLTPQACRVCGCTDDAACMFGCHWVEPDLCSSCIDEAKG